MKGITSVNVGSALGYGADEVTAQLRDVVRDVFEHGTAQVFPVTSGTAANALALSAMCPPWGAVLCHETAHILKSEGGATSLLGGGAVMVGIGGDDFRVDADLLRARLESTGWGDPHYSQPSVLSLTSPTDMGTIYPVDDVARLATIAAEYGLQTHLDGARIANAIAALGCTPAEYTWKAGVQAVSLGCTKNGALSAEAIVVFDEEIAAELVFRTKRSGHTASKMRFQSAQVVALLADEEWLRLARHSNSHMERLAQGLASANLESAGLRFINRRDVNMLYLHVGDTVAAAMADAGMLFYEMGQGVVRLVTSWQTTNDDVDRAVEIISSALHSTAMSK